MVTLRKSKPSSMWTTRVFSSASRSPSGARTAATSSRSASACWRWPDTMTTKSSAKRTSRQLPRPCLLRLARCTWVPICVCHCRVKWSSSADSAMFASSGDNTPPTQWIIPAMVTLRIGSGVVLPSARAAWPGGDAVPDSDLLGADEDVLDEQPQHPLAVFDGGGGCVAAQLGEEAFQVAGEGEVGVPVGGLGVEGVELAAQVRLAGAQVGHLGAQLVDGQELLGECLDHGGDRGGGLGQLEFEAVALAGGRVGGAGGIEPFADLGADQGRVGEQGGDVVPHDGVEVVS